MTEPDHDAWLQRVRERLDASTQSLDARTLSRLNRARQAALASRQRRRTPIWGGLAAAGASALALALALGVQRPPPEPSAPPGAPRDAGTVASDSGDDDLLATEDLEFFEDLDFYQWLDHEGLAPSPTEPNPRRPL